LAKILLYALCTAVEKETQRKQQKIRSKEKEQKETRPVFMIEELQFVINYFNSLF
jgi:hypothetical protein